MQRTYKRLSVAGVNKLVAASAPGMFPDGDGLYLSISKAGSASWSFKYMLAGRKREMGLGPVRDVGLKRARELAQDARQLKREGTDPLEARREKKLGTAVAKAKTMTFQQCAKAYITAHQAGWKNAQHRTQWVRSLEAYAFPVIGKLPVADIDLNLVMQVLQPIWHEKTETASRVRGRIESVLDWAAVSGYRSGDNPARWKVHLEHKLATKAKITVIKHHAALPYADIAAIMSDLRSRGGDDPRMRALELAILCVSRTSEVLAAHWEEFKLKERLWVIPAERMKARKEHQVPLSDAAMAILEKQQAIRTNEFVFAGDSSGHANDKTLSRALKALGRGEVTPHGFRSTFSDWCAETTEFASEVREMALAHAVGNKVEEAYRRGPLLAKRRALAEAWAAYCDGAEVIDFPAEARSA